MRPPLGVRNKSWPLSPAGPSCRLPHNGALSVPVGTRRPGPRLCRLLLWTGGLGTEPLLPAPCCSPRAPPGSLGGGCLHVTNGYSSKVGSLCLSQKDTPSSTGHQTTITCFKRLYNFLVKMFKDVHAITGRNLPQVLSEMSSFMQSCALGITAHFTDEETEAQRGDLTGQPQTSEPGFGLKHVSL